MRRRLFSLTHGRTLENVVRNFSAAERFAFGVLALALLASVGLMLWHINRALLVTIPAEGGSFEEGLIGSPRFINPVLALSDTDRDLTMLVYSGLMRATPAGELIPDLAKDYAISNDGKTYTFTLRDSLSFQDGTPLTAEDVVFTVERAQDPAIRSPKRANWEGVHVEAVSDREVRFTLTQAYAPFLENTTLGILPKHVWKSIDADQFAFSTFNIEPVGSGPYTMAHVSRDKSGVVTDYTLDAFRDFALGRPYIQSIHFKFYSSEDALVTAFTRGNIESLHSLSPERVAEVEDDGGRVESAPLPRIFGVFFNQNQAPLFARPEVRSALLEATDKDRIVREALAGFGVPIDSPIPAGFFTSLVPNASKPTSTASSTEASEVSARLARARAILEAAGWKRSDNGTYELPGKDAAIPLSFTLATSDAPELKQTASILQDEWRALGADVSVGVFESGDLNQNVIRPRRYDALLFGEAVGRDLDLFAFWHSSQRSDPGLNIALYTSIEADHLLEEARTLSDESARNARYAEFERELKTDIPALFLYSPDFIYVAPQNVKGFTLGTVTTASERFLSVYDWYIATERVWPFFAHSAR